MWGGPLGPLLSVQFPPNKSVYLSESVTVIAIVFL